AATASGGASERVPAPLAPFLVIPFKPSCDRLSATLLPLDSRRGGRSGRSSFQRRFWSRDVEVPIALASPLKFPGCGGFVSSAAPAKLPERGGSDNSIVAVGSGLLVEFSSEVDGSSDGRSMFERSPLLGPCIELWRMRSRSRLILSEIRRTWEGRRSRRGRGDAADRDGMRSTSIALLGLGPFLDLRVFFSEREFIVNRGETRHHHNNNNHPCNVDECAVNFAFHVASLGEHVLVVFRRNVEDSFRLDCSSSLIDLSSKKRLVYIDIGAADHLTTRSNWFFPSYPIEKKAFNSYFVHHNTLVLTSYVKSPGVTFIYHPGLAAATKAGTGDQEEPFVEDDSFDFLEWFKETTSFADFVVLKMNTSGAELKFLYELINSGTICSVDELFLNCKGYRDCTSIHKESQKQRRLCSSVVGRLKS
ncbi:hypothetical protein HID58_082129, partial [Brassica napus]